MSLDIEKLQELCRTARDHLGVDCIIAGGAVRDTLHGREVKDIDVFARFEFGPGAASEDQFLDRCRSLAAFWKAHPGGENIEAHRLDGAKTSTEGELFSVVQITGAPFTVEVIALNCDPVDRVQRFDFALSQCFVTPGGLFYTERYLGDANGLTVTYTGTRDVTSSIFANSVARYKRLKAKYAPEFKFLDCELLDKVASDAFL
jgi:hypothetical protein